MSKDRVEALKVTESLLIEKRAFARIARTKRDFPSVIFKKL